MIVQKLKKMIFFLQSGVTILMEINLFQKQLKKVVKLLLQIKKLKNPKMEQYLYTQKMSESYWQKFRLKFMIKSQKI